MDQSSDRIVFARDYVDRLCRVLRSLPFEDLGTTLELLERALIDRRQVFLAGNGGSAATASHMAADLIRGVALRDARGLRAIALTDNVACLTAIANDESYEDAFASQLIALGQPGDLLILFSGSGNSSNIVRIASVARSMHITVIAFLGMGGGEVASMADVSVVVPSDDYGPVEDVHLVFDHLVTAYLRCWLKSR